tara:strand:- start:4838 stop:5056 length:219 start_codon:yes stop_codon:yes gene_type:complete
MAAISRHRKNDPKYIRAYSDDSEPFDVDTEIIDAMKSVDGITKILVRDKWLITLESIEDIIITHNDNDKINS